MSQRLLVVDDFEMNREALSRRLRRCGFDVDEASGGKRALELLSEQRFDLVLLDVIMPDVDGFTVLKEIRSRFTSTELPVIMVTAKDASAEVVAAFRLGANDHVSKPIDFDVTLARIQSWLCRREAHEFVFAPPSPPPQPQMVPQTSKPLVDSPLYSLRPPQGADVTLAPRLPDGLPASAVVDQDLRVGTPLGSYTITGFLGRGGMGVVYEAESEALGRPVALKLLHPHLTHDVAASHRFRSEARATALIEHPNVVGVYDVGKWNDRVYIAMQLVRGRTGQSLIAERGALPCHEASRIIRDACRGLLAAHARGVIHRDLKPDNILICDDGSVKLTDFGLAKMNSAHLKDGALTQTGALLGTPYYMSPEQIRGETVDARSDIYSLGCTYYAFLTGRHPYGHHKACFEVLMAHCIDAPPDVGTDLPDDCRQVVLRCTAKKPADRYGDAADLLAALDQLPPR